MIEQQNRCWREELVPALAQEDIRILDCERLEEGDRDWAERYYRALVRPVLTPLGIDPNNDGGGLFRAAVTLWLMTMTLLVIRRHELFALIGDLGRAFAPGPVGRRETMPAMQPTTR